MLYICGLLVSLFAAIAMAAVDVPDRWLYPAALVVFVLFVIVFRGAEEEHA